MDVVAEVDRVIDRRSEQDDLDENTKKIHTNSWINERPNEIRSG